MNYTNKFLLIIISDVPDMDFWLSGRIRILPDITIFKSGRIRILPDLRILNPAGSGYPAGFRIFFIWINWKFKYSRGNFTKSVWCNMNRKQGVPTIFSLGGSQQILGWSKYINWIFSWLRDSWGENWFYDSFYVIQVRF